MEKDFSELAMDIYRINYQVCDGCERCACKSSILKYLILSAVSLCFVQTSTAETNLNAEMPIKNPYSTFEVKVAQ